MAFQKVATLDDLWSGEKLGVMVAARRVLLVNIDGTVYAYEDRCAHLGVALSEGSLQDTVLTCRAHCWAYDVCTGRGYNPATARLQALAVRVDNGSILVDVEQTWVAP
jgi:toluene monooxygenase system ferredoxin subunit